MHFSTFLTYAAVASTTGWAAYVLEDDYMADGNFFDKFTFWDTSDPTDGFVAYQAQSAAQSAGLISASSSNVRMGVDSTNVTPNGRPSVRITSTKSYDSGLVILDLDHMPGGICGTWPAFWMVGPNWPNQGEIDIIEGVNDGTTNSMTLHTGPGCSISSSNAFSGTIATNNCDVNAPNQANNAGCGIRTTNTQSYGAGFNQNNGGVYATEWTSNGIAIYFFPRGSIPSDITNGTPDPSSWGEPMALFQGSGCDYSSSFTNQQIVFDTTFCGQWAGNVWSGSSCAASTGASTCNAFVQNNPSAFQDAYWSVNALKVYSNNGGSASPSGWGTQSNAAPPTASVGQPSGAPAPTSWAPQSGAPTSWGPTAGAPTSWGATPVASGAASSKPAGSSKAQSSAAPTPAQSGPAPSNPPSGAPYPSGTAPSGAIPSGPASSGWAPSAWSPSGWAPSGHAPSGAASSTWVTVTVTTSAVQAPPPASSPAASNQPWAPTVPSSGGIVQGPTSAAVLVASTPAAAPSSPAQPSDNPSSPPSDAPSPPPSPTWTANPTWTHHWGGNGNHARPTQWNPQEHRDPNGAWDVGIAVEQKGRKHSRHMKHLAQHHGVHHKGGRRL